MDRTGTWVNETEKRTVTPTRKFSLTGRCTSEKGAQELKRENYSSKVVVYL